jgi:hypothetical protein
MNIKGVGEMEVGDKVKVSNPNQINYPLKGTVTKKETAPDGTEMSKVKFVTAEVWYADKDLKELK